MQFWIDVQGVSDVEGLSNSFTFFGPVLTQRTHISILSVIFACPNLLHREKHHAVPPGVCQLFGRLPRFQAIPVGNSIAFDFPTACFPHASAEPEGEGHDGGSEQTSDRTS